MSKNHNHFEEKGEPKRNRAEALLLTSLTPYRWAKRAPKKRNEKTDLISVESEFRCRGGGDAIHEALFERHLHSTADPHLHPDKICVLFN